jgi:tRNA (cmo5U34)-methyltransferase
VNEKRNVTEGWKPDSYLDEIRAEIPRYDELQDRVAKATFGLAVRRALELGVGTGETARRLLTLHRLATLVGIDGSEAMLLAARAKLPAERVDLRLARLEEPLPAGPFDLVVSVLAVHHLRAMEKAALFRAIASATNQGGRFVLGDVFVPERSEDSVTPIEEGFDYPDSLADQLTWLGDAGFSTTVVWSWRDLAVVRADLSGGAQGREEAPASVDDEGLAADHLGLG